MDRAAQVEAAPVRPHLLAPCEPRPHGAGKARGERVGARNLGRIDEVAQVDRRDVLGTRSAFAATLSRVCAIRLVGAAPLDVIRQGRRLRRNYVVKPGDSFGSIVEKTGVSLAQLEELNPDVDPQALVVGQRIKLRE